MTGRYTRVSHITTSTERGATRSPPGSHETVIQRMARVWEALRGCRLPLEDEKQTQAAIAEVLAQKLGPVGGWAHQSARDPVVMWSREVPVAGGIIDFVALRDIGIEVKLKGAPLNIVRQLHAYAAEPAISGLVLVTAKPVALPATIRGKPVAVVDLGRAWL